MTTKAQEKAAREAVAKLGVIVDMRDRKTPTLLDLLAACLSMGVEPPEALRRAV